MFSRQASLRQVFGDMVDTIIGKILRRKGACKEESELRTMVRFLRRFL
jgi:hypothetical protein